MAKNKSKGPIIPEMTPARLEEQRNLKRWRGVKTAPTIWEKSETEELRSELGQAWGSPKIRYPRK